MLSRTVLLASLLFIAACSSKTTASNPAAADASAGDDGELCCPISPSPSCCMEFGGSRANRACGALCDSLPDPDYPGWTRSVDDAGCPFWVASPNAPIGCMPWANDTGGAPIDVARMDVAPIDATVTDVAVTDGADAACTQDGPDVWAWDAKIVTVPADRDAFFAFAATKKVRRVYVEAEALVSGPQPPLLAFVSEAKSRCIEVELLFGYAQWAFTPNHGAAVALATKAKGLGLTAHFDVEPYSTPAWTSDQNGTANQLIDLYEKLAATGVRLAVDVPFWFDTIQVTRAGTTRPLHEWVVDRVDVLTIMDYRDKAEPPDGIIDNAATELAYAASKGKRVVIGVETMCNLEPEKVTFCEEGSAAMTAALAATKTAHGGSAAFGGFAVHDYASWKTLVP